jgi:hypothetical protein
MLVLYSGDMGKKENQFYMWHKVADLREGALARYKIDFKLKKNRI